MLKFNKRKVSEVVKNTANDVGGLRFDSQAGQIVRSVTSGSPPLDVCSKLCCCAKPWR